MATVIAHHALGLPGGTRRIQDVEGIRRFEGNAGGRLRAAEGILPVKITAGCETGCYLRTLQHDTALHTMARKLQGLVQQRLVRNDPLTFDPTGG